MSLQAQLHEAAQALRPLELRASRSMEDRRYYYAKKSEMQQIWLDINTLSRRVHLVAGDGDCMYASLSQLFRLDFHLLRAAIVGFARCNPTSTFGAGL